MEGDMFFDFLPDDKTKLVVVEKISWTCKANRSEIQDVIRWLPELDEFLEVRKTEICLNHKTFKQPFNVPIADITEYKKNSGLGFEMPLATYKIWMAWILQLKQSTSS